MIFLRPTVRTAALAGRHVQAEIADSFLRDGFHALRPERLHDYYHDDHRASTLPACGMRPRRLPPNVCSNRDVHHPIPLVHPGPDLRPGCRRSLPSPSQRRLPSSSRRRGACRQRWYSLPSCCRHDASRSHRRLLTGLIFFWRRAISDCVTIICVERRDCMHCKRSTAHHVSDILCTLSSIRRYLIVPQRHIALILWSFYSTRTYAG
ncbi:hypothetical protein SCHPADRAFT_256588 [Schizopora paradoxa]|uniref:Uncharacterized protein n=1 Tax=Schizopora paradoxa TaxID=27342 RepID=A0A0H2SEX7_9AGAM|nr:hypothetical protein SCHPADRAFT_256588 [Schizopora paradoxa]